MQDFRQLQVWQKSHSLTLSLYRLTAGFPREEIYGLTSQLRRAASSIGANLAEGCCRHGDRGFARFVQIAKGSASETDYFLLLSRDLGHRPEEQYMPLKEHVQEIKRMLSGLLMRLRTARD